MSEGPILVPYRGVLPKIAPDVFVAPGAAVIGDVAIGAKSSIWFGCVVRGDVQPITIGERTNVQDGTIVHVTRDGLAAHIGSNVLIGHACIVHACTLMNRAFVGMGAVVMDGAVIESDGMLAAGALLTPGKRLPARQLWAGRPARFVRDLSDAEIAESAERTAHYVELAEEYRTSR